MVQPGGNGGSSNNKKSPFNAAPSSFSKAARPGTAGSSTMSSSLRGKSSSNLNLHNPGGVASSAPNAGSTVNLGGAKAQSHENSQMLIMSTTPSPFIQQIYSSRKRTTLQSWSDTFFNWLEGIPIESLDGPLKSTTRSRGYSRRKRTRSNSFKDSRKIYVNCKLPKDQTDHHGRPLVIYPQNGVNTTKYSALSFLPKNLFEQFRRVANFVFIVLAGIQFYGQVRTTDPFFGAAPIIIILTLTAIKDGVEDWERHVADKRVNNDIVFRLENYKNFNDRASHPNYNRPPKADIEAIRDALSRGKKKKGLKDRVKGSMEAIKKSFTSLISKSNRTANPNGESNGNSSSTNASNSNPNYEMAQVSVEAGRKLSKSSNTSSSADNRISSGWYPILSKDLKVGDIIQLRNNETIPADLVVIATSEPDCLCYVETKNLDGETNLKIKRAPIESSWIKSSFDCELAELLIECDQPNINLYSFNARMTFFNESAAKASSQSGEGDVDGPLTEKIIPLSVASLLLRGCTVRNTNFLYGVVIGTGVDTKLMLNSGETPSKRSRIERRLNPQVILNFLLLVIMSMLCSLIYMNFIGFYEKDTLFLSLSPQNETKAFIGFKTFLSGLLLFQNIVPISLYLTLELCKSLQAGFIYSDVEMYHEETDTPCVPKSWNLSDDLGQIEYIFSDKTGTLTRNVMELKKISVNGIVYGMTDVDFEKVMRPQEVGITDDSQTEEITPEYIKARMINEMKTMLRPAAVSETQTLIDHRLFVQLRDNPAQSRNIIDYFRILTVCHTVLAQKPPAHNQTQTIDLAEETYHDIIYKAQSPDEEALVSAARNLGFTFLGRDKDSISIDCLGKIEKFKILNILEFNSTRKRMSVIVRKSSGEIVLYCKGADSIIYERLADNRSIVEDETLNQLELFAGEGLRTLCLAYRQIDEIEYGEWLERYNDAANSLGLVGATAIEDQLQEGVPETIEILSQAGIKIWVLTGDKMETAINIGFSCNLLTQEMLLLVIKGVDSISTQKQIQDSLEQIFGNEDSAAREKLVAAAMDAGVKIGSEGSAANKQQSNFDKDLKHVPIALIIDGHSLKFALEKESRLLFLELACRCKAVICCRVSPLQKAKVVELMKKGKKVMTLAIGEGATDAADIGVGISGEEGVQAVMASDYAIAQFRFLKRLLLVHGRYSYIRTAELSLNAFYKNVIFTLICFWFQFYCAFSAELAYDAVYNMLFNLILCNFPIVAVGFLDQDVSQSFSLKVPQLYMWGILQKAYTLKLFLLYNLDGIYQSLVCFYVPAMVYIDSTFGPQGFGDQKSLFGMIAAFTSVICANVYVGLNNYSWNYITVFAVCFGILAFIVLTIIVNAVPEQMLFGSLAVILVQPTFYFTVFVTCVVTLFPRVFFKYLQSTFMPNDIDIIREVEKFGIDNDVSFQYSRRRSSANINMGASGDPGNLESGGAFISIPERTFTKGGSGGGDLGLVTEGSLPSSVIHAQSSNPGSLKNRPKAFGRRILEEFGIVKPTNILYMRTGRFEKLRGFAFSQEEGMKDVVTGKAFGTAVKLRPELELKRLPKAAIRDNVRYPKGSSLGSMTSIMSSGSQFHGVMDAFQSPGSLRSQPSTSSVRLDQIRTRNASGSRRFSTDENSQQNRPGSSKK